MDVDQSIRTKEQLIGQMVLAMNDDVYSNHGNIHEKRIGYAACTVGICGRLNPLIKRAQQMGFTSTMVPRR